MPVPVIVIDGAQPYGVTFVGSIGGKTYVVENFTITRPMTIATDRTQTGAPQRKRGTADFVTAAATLQAPAGTTGWPVAGEVLGPILVDSNYGNESFWIEPPNYEASNDPSAIRKINVTFHKVYNTITTSST